MYNKKKKKREEKLKIQSSIRNKPKYGAVNFNIDFINKFHPAFNFW